MSSYLTAFPGHYLTGDGGMIDADGYLFVMGRIDDVINVAGHRLSTGAIEEVVAAHPDVAECAVFGDPRRAEGQVPLGLVVLKAGAVRDPDELRAELVALVRDQIGAWRRSSDSPSCRAAAEDALRQDPARDDARARRGPRGGRCPRRSRTRPCSTRSPRCSPPAWSRRPSGSSGNVVGVDGERNPRVQAIVR